MAIKNIGFEINGFRKQTRQQSLLDIWFIWLLDIDKLKLCVFLLGFDHELNWVDDGAIWCCSDGKERFVARSNQEMAAARYVHGNVIAPNLKTHSSSSEMAADSLLLSVERIVVGEP